MPKQVIVLMDDHYPFGECEESTNELTRVLVRKIYQVSVQEKNRLLEKANILRKLKSEQLIKLDSVLQEDQTMHFLFEYVPIRLETWISNINDQFIENFRDQVIKFSSYLANNFIKIDFKLKNIGMDHNYGAKYFLDPSFTYDPTLNKQKLKSQYIRDISNLFKPYIESSQEESKTSFYGNNKNPTKQVEKNEKNQPPNKRKNYSISPPTNDYQDQPVPKDQSSNKTKQKLQKYYQHMNASMDVENEKILQEFMDVLDDEEEEQIHPHKHSGHPPSVTKVVPFHYNHEFEARQNQNKVSQRKMQPVPQQISNPKIFANTQSAQNIEFPKQNFNMTSPAKMPQNSQLASQYPQEGQVVWKDQDDLQQRIKKAIYNSKSIINRFKTIKQSRS